MLYIVSYLRKIQTLWLVLEVGSGSGQHTKHFSSHYPNVVFQPTEYDVGLLPSIEAYAEDLNQRGHHIKRPLELDATSAVHWEAVLESGLAERTAGSANGVAGCYDLVVTTNVFHISPWVVGESIVRGAGKVLSPGGHLIIYGPFKKNGQFNTESNREVSLSSFSSHSLLFSPTHTLTMLEIGI